MVDGNRGDAGYAAFREALLAGAIQMGGTLTQNELCKILGMSLSPLRTTMTLLESDGLIRVRKRAGVQVFYPDVGFIRSNFQFRAMIEREAMVRFTETIADFLARHHDRPSSRPDGADQGSQRQHQLCRRNARAGE